MPFAVSSALRRMLVPALFAVGACEGEVGPSELGAQQAGIVAGEPAPEQESVVAVLNESLGGLCTGAVIGERLVLTAKHCIQGPGEDRPTATSHLYVAFGADLADRNVRYRQVTAVHTTPGTYTDDPQSLADDLLGKDLAVLTLARAAEVPALPMVLGSPEGEVGHAALAVGYGETPEDEVGLRLETSTAVLAVDDVSLIVEGTVCQGDSGGPLLNEQGAVIGVVSVGAASACGERGDSYYQRVDRHVGLIRTAFSLAGECLDEGAEQCDGRDNDCDGLTDEVCGEDPGCEEDGSCEEPAPGDDGPDEALDCVDEDCAPEVPDSADGATASGGGGGCSLATGPGSAFGASWVLLLGTLLSRRRQKPR